MIREWNSKWEFWTDCQHYFFIENADIVTTTTLKKDDEAKYMFIGKWWKFARLELAFYLIFCLSSNSFSNVLIPEESSKSLALKIANSSFFNDLA